MFRQAPTQIIKNLNSMSAHKDEGDQSKMKACTQTAEIDINEEEILLFENGIYGFESVKEYVLLSEEENSRIFVLQPVRYKVPSFVVIDPYAIYPEYQPQLSEEDLKYFSVSKEDLRFLLITAVKENYKDTSVNLKSPIVIDPKTRRSRQVILENPDYPIRYQFLHKKKGA